MPEVRHFELDRMPFTQTHVGDKTTSICRAVTGEISRTMGAGIETLEDVSLEWTVTYDEILFIREGELTIRSGGRSHLCRPGDIVWLPNGASLVYDATGGRCSYFYALYPVDWAARQGTVEP